MWHLKSVLKKMIFNKSVFVKAKVKEMLRDEYAILKILHFFHHFFSIPKSQKICYFFSLTIAMLRDEYAILKILHFFHHFLSIPKGQKICYLFSLTIAK